jgi:hypothetical protein
MLILGNNLQINDLFKLVTLDISETHQSCFRCTGDGLLQCGAGHPHSHGVPPLTHHALVLDP